VPGPPLGIPIVILPRPPGTGIAAGFTDAASKVWPHVRQLKSTNVLARTICNGIFSSTPPVNCTRLAVFLMVLVKWYW
jgi:hypothetical protein